MKLKLLSEELDEVLQYCILAVPRVGVVPLYESFFVVVRSGLLKIHGADMEKSMIKTIGVEHTGNIEFCINAKVFSALISTLAGELDLICEDGKVLHIVCPATEGEYKLSIVTEDAFTIPEYDNAATKVSFGSKELKDALSFLKSYTANDEIRPKLNGIHLDFLSNEKINLVATDGHRLAQYAIEVTADKFLTGDQKSITIPTDSIDVLRKILPQDEAVELVFTEDNQLVFKTKNQVFISRLISEDHKFPNYRSVVPETTEIKVKLAQADLARSIKIAKAYGSENNKISLDISQNDMVVASGQEDIGDEGLFAEGKEHISVENSGDIKVFLNLKLISEVLGTFSKCTDIELGLNYPEKAVTISDATNNNGFIGKAMIMPVRE